MVKTKAKTLAKVITLGVAIAIGVINTAASKTNYDTIHNNHEIVSKYESGVNGYEAIAKDNYGGYSYGKWQLSTERRNGNKSTFDFFLLYLKKHHYKYYKILMVAGGQPAAYKGTPEFKLMWRELSRQKAFQQQYNNFLLDEQILPVYYRLDKKDCTRINTVIKWSVEDNAIQGAIKSMIIQHGATGAYNMIIYIVNNYSPLSKKDFLTHAYNYRAKRFPKYSNRYKSELTDLLTYLKSGKSKIG